MTGDRLEELQAEARKLQYQQHQEDMRAAFQLQGDYGKWLVASLLLIHGVSIWFLAESQELARTILPAVFWWHVIGLLLALTCGFVAWINWSLHTVLYAPLDPGMILDTRNWPQADPKKTDQITLTYRLSLVTGVASAICILGAAIVAYCTMGSNPALAGA